MSAVHLPHRLTVVDSHTAGEPTRCVLGGLPDLGAGSLRERLQNLRENHDYLRRAILCEPRGSDVLVGAYIVEPVDPASAAGVIFFNNAGYLGMCGHGTIGVAVTLAHLGHIQPGEHRLETPVGPVTIDLHDKHQVSIRNVPAYRYRAAVPVDVPGFGTLRGDIAWGGNWFFLTSAHPAPLTLEHKDELTAYTWAIRCALVAANISGADGADIDHIELSSEPLDEKNSSRNFVLCPGKAYDRSPCGTGTSAKLACLAADKKLEPDQTWHQEGILGTVFSGSFDFVPHDSTDLTDNLKIIPTITGSAYITSESNLLYDPADPFLTGVPE